MVHLSSLAVLLLGELLVALGLALGTLLFVNARRKRRDRRAAMRLVEFIRGREAQRFGAIQGVLDKRYHYRPPHLDQTAHALLRAEKYLYQRLLNAYIRRDTATLDDLHIQVDGLVEGYWRLELPKGGEAPSEDRSRLDDIIQRLMKENESLKAEMRVTTETMARLLSDYSSMFGKPETPEGSETPAEEPEKTPVRGAEDLVQGAEDLQELELPALAAAAPPVDLGLSGDPGGLWDAFAADADGGDQTQVLSPVPGADVDLGGAGDDLDDIWAQALAEQESVEGSGGKG